MYKAMYLRHLTAAFLLLLSGEWANSDLQALELLLDTTNKSGSYVVTHTNNKGYKVLYWNFKLDPTFTGSGSLNTVTSILFQLWANSPQGTSIVPLNLGIYNGYFDATKYSNASQTLGQPIGNSPALPLNDASTPQGGIQTQGTQSGPQLALLTWTPPKNQSFVNYPILWTNPTAFNGTSPNALGEYSLVIWTESTANYQIKNDGQLMIGGVPGVSYSSSSPGTIDGTTGTLVTTAPGTLNIAPVPEPATSLLACVAATLLALISRLRRAALKVTSA